MKLELDEEVLKQPKLDEEAIRQKQLREEREEQIEIYNKIIKTYWIHSTCKQLYDQIYPDLEPLELEDENSLSLYDRSKYSPKKREAEKEKIRERNKEKTKQFEKLKAEYYRPDMVLFKICLMRVAIEHHKEAESGPYLWNEVFSIEEVPEVKKIRRLFYKAQKSKVEIIAVSDILKILWPNLTKHDLLRKELLIFKVVYRCLYYKYQPGITDYEWSMDYDKIETYLWLAKKLITEYASYTYAYDGEVKKFEAEIGWGEPEPKPPNWEREKETGEGEDS